MKTETVPELHVTIAERGLSDKSRVFAVRISEQGGLPFIELDALNERHAIDLHRAIIVAIANHTNVSVAP